jgi:hypothetical protein
MDNIAVKKNRVQKIIVHMLVSLLILSVIFTYANHDNAAAAETTTIYFKDLAIAEGTTSSGTNDITSADGYPHRRMRTQAVGEASVFKFDAPAAGLYHIVFYPVVHSYGGESDIALNGSQIGLQDFHSHGGPRTLGKANDLGSVELNAGLNEISFTVTRATGRDGYFQQYLYALELTQAGTTGSEPIDYRLPAAGEPLFEDFNQLATESQPSGWDAGLAAVKEFPGPTNKSLLLNTSTEDGNSDVFQEFRPIKETFTVSYDVYAEETDGYYYLYLSHLYGSNGKRPVRFYMDDNRDFWSSNGKDKMVLGKYKGNTWYHVKQVIDVTQQKFDLYINGVVVALDFHFRDQVDDISKIGFSSIKGSNGYIDNLKIAVDGKLIGEHYGAELAPIVLGEPTGGGEGYRKIVNPSDAKFIVSHLEELKTALERATSGDIIYIRDESEIDLTPLGTESLLIPEGVTLASGRGHDGSNGALLFTNFSKDMEPDTEKGYKNRNRKLNITGLLKTTGPNVRITGLRIRGNDGERHDDLKSTYMLPLSRGINADYSIEVDNTEISHFSLAAILVRDKAHVHHNFIHETPRKALGYGLVLYGEADVLAEGNIFDNNRHAIAASGESAQRYEARYNLVHDTTLHAFDMHNYKENDSQWGVNGGVYIAGASFKIHHNTFTDTNLYYSPASTGKHKIITIRGVPVYGAYIDHNWFHIPEEEGYYAVRQYNSYGSHFVGKNLYGPSGDNAIREGWLPRKEPNFVVSSVAFTDNEGNKITEFKPLSLVNVSAKISNRSWRADHATVMAVLKNAKGYVTDIQMLNKEFIGRTTYGEGASEVVNLSFKLPRHVEGYSLEVFIWDSLEGMKPVTPLGPADSVIRDVKIQIAGQDASIGGNVSSGEGSHVTVKVYNPYGALDYIGQTTSGQRGSFNFFYELDSTMSGAYTVEIGGDGIDQPQTADFNYMAPPIIVDPTDDMVTNDTTPSIIVKADIGSAIKIYEGTDIVGNGTGAGDKDVVIALVELEEGVHSLKATATSLTGATSEEVELPTLTIDTTAPEVPVVADPIRPMSTNDTTPDVAVKAEAGTIITIKEGGRTVGRGIGAGESAVVITLNSLSVGNHKLKAAAMDAAGNFSVESEVFQMMINNGSTK